MYTIVPTNEKYAESFLQAVDSVKDEGDFLFATLRFKIDETMRFMQAARENDNPAFLALNEKDNVIGWCDISPGNIEETRHVGVLGMGIVASERGKGIGEELLSRSITMARHKGMEKIELQVFATNEAARALYRKYGFSEEGLLRRKRKYRNHYDDLVCMGLFL
jgi:RimJ/RimL family protein N-acetyltransferase